MIRVPSVFCKSAFTHIPFYCMHVVLWCISQSLQYTASYSDRSWFNTAYNSTLVLEGDGVFEMAQGIFVGDFWLEGYLYVIYMCMRFWTHITYRYPSSCKSPRKSPEPSQRPYIPLSNTKMELYVPYIGSAAVIVGSSTLQKLGGISPRGVSEHRTHTMKKEWKWKCSCKTCLGLWSSYGLEFLKNCQQRELLEE